MIHVEKIKLDQPFNLSVFSDLAKKEGFSLLHSGEGGMENEHWTIVGLEGKPYFESEKAFERLQNKAENLYPHLPITHGSIGYLAYPNVGLKNEIPNRYFNYYDSLCLYNHRIKECFVSYQNNNQLEKWKALLFQKECCSVFNYQTSGDLEQSFSKEGYIKKILQIKELLAAGEVYQINFALRFRKQFSGDAYGLFLKLSQSNPVDFQAYINAGDHQIVSSSPERFFSVKNGKIVTQPIKGTARKTSNSYSDPNLKQLISSEKERAELDMITDLERNDIGKICDYGTLTLNKERAVLELPNLWHCYSEVEGRLRVDVGTKEIIEAMFPGGSITGCPKKRAMETISELEGLPRNIYTGSVGYIAEMTNEPIPNTQYPISNLPTCGRFPIPNDQYPHQSLAMDFNIAIRTILIKDGYLEFWAGGGIVADSDPEAEYEECMLKAEKLLNLL